ncbi:MAG: trigger factor [Emergencia sp.]
MKKRIFQAGLTAVLCLTVVFTMAGCGDEEPYSGLDLSEYVKVADYKGMEYDKISVSVSKDEIQDEINSRLEEKATTEQAQDGTVEDGDTINVAFEGRIDGKTFEGGTSDDYKITIGQTTMIDGFVEGLIGQQVGDTVTLDLKFPDDYSNTDVAGKDVTFEVNIKSRDVEVVPEYNLDFVKENSEYDTLADYEASVKKDLLAQKQEEAELDVKQALWEQIVENSEIIKYPEEKEQRIEDEIMSMKNDAKDNDMEWETYLDTVGYTEDELKELVTSYVEKTMFQEMILYSIAEKEELEVTDEEYQDYVDSVLEASGMDAETFESSIGMTVEEYCDSMQARSSLLLNKVMDKVMEYASEK